MTRPELDPAGLEHLDSAACYRLLATVPVGRIAFTEAGTPAIQPVNFVLDGEDVVFRTRAGSKVAAAARSAVVAFEADHYDRDSMTGWSVVIVGRAHPVTDAAELERLWALPLIPWALGSRPEFIRITPRDVRGRRIQPRIPAV